MSANQYFDFYKSNGYNFSKKILTQYCLSLYTKPFVILSGISGTGKTKIAQLFKTFEDSTIPLPNQKVDPFDYIIMNVTKGARDEDGRGNLKYSDLNVLFEKDEIAKIDEKISELISKGSDNITESKNFIIETEEGEFTVGIYLQRATSPLLRVRFISKRGEKPAYNSQPFLKKNYKVGDILKLQKVAPGRLKLIAVNEKAVVDVNKELESQELHAVENKLFIPVKSNWNDSSELFGYFNILDDKYHITPFLKFILTAKENPEKPFFLILDEMNLSRVEHYFSDYLSCLESRIMIDGRLHQEEVNLHNFSFYTDSNDPYFDVIPNKIAIPNNLYVTGTVNIDETTYTFSPKVLDRANVIEFNEVDLKSYYPNSQDEIVEVFELAKFPRFAQATLSSTTNFTQSPEEFKSCVADMLNILQPYNLHFGYRVVNEMAHFLENTIEYVGNDPEKITAGIDIQISQKVLPKLNGAFGKLDEPVRKLISYMVHQNIDQFTIIDISYTEGIDFTKTKFPYSLKKLVKLYHNLVYNGFATFLE